MREFQVRLQSVQDVQEFVSLSTARGFPVIIRDANNKVNGKSFMEMFCLDLCGPLRVNVVAARRSLPFFCVTPKGSSSDKYGSSSTVLGILGAGFFTPSAADV